MKKWTNPTVENTPFEYIVHHQRSTSEKPLWHLILTHFTRNHLCSFWFSFSWPDFAHRFATRKGKYITIILKNKSFIFLLLEHHKVPTVDQKYVFCCGMLSLCLLKFLSLFDILLPASNIIFAQWFVLLL